MSAGRKAKTRGPNGAADSLRDGAIVALLEAGLAPGQVVQLLGAQVGHNERSDRIEVRLPGRRPSLTLLCTLGREASVAVVEYLVECRRYGEETPLFTARDSRPLSPEAVRQVASRARRRARRRTRRPA